MAEVSESIVKAVAARLSEFVRGGDKLLVCVSGGPDSMALLDIMNEISSGGRYDIAVAHYDYGIRKPDSELDRRLVRQRCEKLGVPFSWSSPGSDAMDSATPEETLRQMRHAYFRRLLREWEGNWIVLGHNRDDRAETFLFRLLRGTGIAGMAAMPFVDPPIIRPLIDLSRAEIMEYLKARNIPYRLDVSNYSERYDRNWIRNRLIPLMRQRREGIVAVLAREAELSTELAEILDRLGRGLLTRSVLCRCGSDILLDLDVLRAYDTEDARLALRALEEVLADRSGPLHGSFRHLDRLVHALHGAPGTSAKITGDFRLELGRNTALVTKGDTESFEFPIPVGGEIAGPGFSFCVSEPRSDCPDRQMLIGLSLLDPFVAFVDAGSVRSQLSIRSPRPGDHVRLLGSGHTKKLSDLFSEAGLPAGLKASWPVLVCGRDVVWPVGFAPSEDFKVSAKTREYLRVSIRGERVNLQRAATAKSQVARQAD